MSDLLFTERPRTDASPLHTPETNFVFYDRVAGYYWDQIRTLLNEWFAHVSAASRDDLRGRFQGKDRRHFDGAFWELYLHELFRRLGLTVQHAPELPRTNRSSLTPDLLIERDGHAIHVEAVTIHDDEDEHRADRRRMDMFDAINQRVHSQSFNLWFEIDCGGASNPPVKRISTQLQSWLDGLDSDRVAILQHHWNQFDWPTCRWEESGWRLRFVAMPRPPDQRSQPNDRVILGGPSGGRVSEVFADARIIRDILNQKGKKYEFKVSSYIIAALIRRSFRRDRDISLALLGHTQYDDEFRRSGVITQLFSDDGDGFWASRSGPKHQGVAAILTAKDLRPPQIAEATPMIWHCPWATQALLDDFPMAQMRLTSGGDPWDHVQGALTPATVFALPTPWPSGDPFP